MTTEEEEEEEEDNIPGIENTSSSSLVSLASESLSSLAAGPMGWKSILTSPKALLRSTDLPTEEERIDYFALCLASHFSTVATYVPTDVDSKIRGHCWNDPSHTVLLKQLEVLFHAMEWDVKGASKKALLLPNNELVSGHDGEFLGILCGAWGAFLRIKDFSTADRIQERIELELNKEAKLFTALRKSKSSPEIDTAMLKLASIMTHNVGDVDQGLSYWEAAEKTHPDKYSLYSRLAHERNDRFGGEFLRAKHIYKELVSAEGHRNYPLREARCLRRSPEFMLPLGPWYERWGRLIGMHPVS